MFGLILLLFAGLYISNVSAATTVPPTTAPPPPPSAAFWVIVGVAGLVTLVILGMIIWWCCCPWDRHPAHINGQLWGAPTVYQGVMTRALISGQIKNQ